MKSIINPLADDVEARHAAGSLTARERIEVLVDEGSFGALGDDTSDGSVVAGCGTIFGRPVFIFAKDFTVVGGSLSAAHAGKIVRVQAAALAARAPIIGLFDTDGARLEEGLAALAGYGDIFRNTVLASGVIPQMSVIMGPCVGADAVIPALGDFTFMVRGTSHLFMSGPGIVKAVTNETVTAEDLGGAALHAGKTGLADGVFSNDVEALLQVRRLVDFLPSSNTGPTPRLVFAPARADAPSLDTLVPDDPHAPYDMRELIAKVADDGDLFEIRAAQAKTVVVAFGRIEGATVGFVANQPTELGGVLDAEASRKAARFVRFCDCFNIPLVTFVDVPGFLPGAAQEHGGLVANVAKLLFAYGEATVPKVTLVTRRAFGAAQVAMGSKTLGADLCLAWPSAQIGLLGATAAVGMLDPAETGKPEQIALRARDYEANVLAPRSAIDHGVVDDIIEPRATRQRIAAGIAALRAKSVETPWKKHDNIPL